MKNKEAGIGRIKILPPKPGTCPVCAAVHEKGTAHDTQSVYFKMRFFQKYGRFPMREDAFTEADTLLQEKHGQPGMDDVSGEGTGGK